MGYFMIDQSAGIAILVAIAILIILFIVIAIRLRSLKKEKDLVDQENQVVRERNQELEEVYNSAIESLNDLTGKYEELNKNKENMKKLAYTDYLTELPNRTAFTEMLDNIMLTLRSEETIGIMDIDIDNFKNINDSLGHSYGDELLIDVTYRLKQAMDENDYLARIGGD
jgi:GGDEF domain-containing protein